MNNIDQRYRMMAQATHHRDQLAMIAKDFVVLHGEEFNTCEADELFNVIFDGTDYDDALRRINRIRASKQKQRDE